MRREIYEVYAKVIDANGNYNILSGYPKVFDSRHYDNDIEKTLRRAKAEYHETYGAMCKRDDRLLQMVVLMRATGDIYEHAFLGTIPDDPDPEPEPEE